MEILKNILALFEVAARFSPETTNILLHKNILEILFTILSHEFRCIDNTVTTKDKDVKSAPSSQKLIADILYLLSALFPKEKEEFDQRIMEEENREYYIYFSDKIISLLLYNIISISSSKIFIQVVRLIKLYVTYSKNDDIQKFIDSNLLANLNSSIYLFL